MTGSKIFGEELNLKNLGRDLFSDLNPIMTTKCMNPWSSEDFVEKLNEVPPCIFSSEKDFIAANNGPSSDGSDE